MLSQCLHDDEFVPADTGHGIHRADRGAQSTRDLYQQPVAGAMSKHVVDELEAIEVQTKQRQPAAGTRSTPEPAPDGRSEESGSAARSSPS